MLNQIQDFINSNCSFLTKEEIYEMNEKDNGAINNVINFRHKHCYGLWLTEQDEILLFYINNQIDLTGLKIIIKPKHKRRNEIILAFSKIISEEYPITDLVETFNTYQEYVRTLFEKFQYFTIGSEIPEGNYTVAVKNKKGVEFVPQLDKTKAFKSLFDNFKFQENPQRDNFIYLMFNPRNGLTKIGRSIKPELREKTLQGEDPETQIIALWKADRKIEKFLHQNFENKRQRGEWFNLSISDLIVLKEMMSKKTGNNNG